MFGFLKDGSGEIRIRIKIKIMFRNNSLAEFMASLVILPLSAVRIKQLEQWLPQAQAEAVKSGKR